MNLLEEITNYRNVITESFGIEDYEEGMDEYPAPELSKEEAMKQLVILGKNLLRWAKGGERTDKIPAIDTEPPQPGNIGNSEAIPFFKKTAQAAMAVYKLLQTDQLNEVDKVVMALPECGKRMIYNRVGKLLDRTLGEKPYRYTYLDPSANGDLIEGDEVIYFG